jgi:hypothetical protein
MALFECYNETFLGKFFTEFAIADKAGQKIKYLREDTFVEYPECVIISIASTGSKL